MRVTADGTMIQRSLIREQKDYKSSAMAYPKLGVILEVRYADDNRNRSSREHEDRRGFIAEASVYMVSDGSILPNVLITPATPSGLDNFVEFLPRAATKTVKGTTIDANLTDTDPYDLDGDWCIVEFLDGNIQTPFISRYFPNPRNVYDCATSGKGNPKFSTSKGTSLQQQGRYFNRTNGVEWVITRSGDVWLSTSRAGSTILAGDAKSDDGRFPRMLKPLGGSICLNVKPSQTIEINFDDQVDGIGANGLFDPSLPQKNPSGVPPIAKAQDNTTITFDKDKAVFNVPLAFVVKSLQQVLLQSPEVILEATQTILAEADNKVTVEAPSILLGEGAFDTIANTTPTMANFNAIFAVINAIISVVKVPTPVTVNTTTGAGATIPTPAASALTPLTSPVPVGTTKTKAE